MTTLSEVLREARRLVITLEALGLRRFRKEILALLDHAIEEAERRELFSGPEKAAHSMNEPPLIPGDS